MEGVMAIITSTAAEHTASLLEQSGQTMDDPPEELSFDSAANPPTEDRAGGTRRRHARCPEEPGPRKFFSFLIDLLIIAKSPVEPDRGRHFSEPSKKG